MALILVCGPLEDEKAVAGLDPGDDVGNCEAADWDSNDESDTEEHLPTAFLHVLFRPLDARGNLYHLPDDEEDEAERYATEAERYADYYARHGN